MRTLILFLFGCCSATAQKQPPVRLIAAASVPQSTHWLQLRPFYSDTNNVFAFDGAKQLLTEAIAGDSLSVIEPHSLYAYENTSVVELDLIRSLYDVHDLRTVAGRKAARECLHTAAWMIREHGMDTVLLHRNYTNILGYFRLTSGMLVCLMIYTPDDLVWMMDAPEAMGFREVGMYRFISRRKQKHKPIHTP